jgi:hypothetical protein
VVAAVEQPLIAFVADLLDLVVQGQVATTVLEFLHCQILAAVVVLVDLVKA